MIKADKLSKNFDDIKALSELSCEISEGSIFGLVGSNGAGKSTFVRLLAGIYRPDGGSISLDGEEVFNNPAALSRMVLVPDELFFLPGASIKRMGELYYNIRGSFDFARLEELSDLLKLDRKRPISTFSKGMKRQAATILAIACRPDVLLFDETFDGLDPVMRSVIKRIIIDDVLEHKTTVIITSHSLRELEDTCDQLALLHKGGLVLQSDIGNLKTSLFKVQIAINGEFGKDDIAKATNAEILSFVKKGSVANVILRGDRDSAACSLQTLNPIILDILPLSLEEVFVYEMEALGYQFSDVLGGAENEK